ncbi:hypothetical protein DYB26_013211 [Aphanomyces astaci]|uniref:Uncharacterized protein n=1 Tax=Aphanomyces astaci TaxID=112090 RepID=A0A3R6XVS3_APHAT|nr:hypothetical protein DYB26_013211 [Aphanomyces astaci]
MPPITLMTHNFASWRVWFIAKLQTKRLANYLDWDGTVAQGANGFEYNELDNLRALGILTESLSESQYQYVDGALLVKTAMDNLTAIHEPIGAADRVALLEEYHTLSWDWKNVPLEEFLGTFRDLTRRLDRAALNELPSFRVTKLLSLMPKEMRMVSHMIMDSNAEFHTVPIAVTKLITEYKYLQKEGILKVAPPSAHANAVRSEPVYDEDYLFSIGPKMPSDQPHELSSRKSSLPLVLTTMVGQTEATTMPLPTMTHHTTQATIPTTTTVFLLMMPMPRMPLVLHCLHAIPVRHYLHERSATPLKTCLEFRPVNATLVRPDAMQSEPNESVSTNAVNATLVRPDEM